MKNSLLHWQPKRWTGLLALAALLLASRPGQAQVDTYTFAPSTGAFTPLVGGTNVSTIQTDDALSGTLPLGFSFVFDGTVYSSCKVSSNGWLTFNTAATNNSLTNDLATGDVTERPRVGPYWDDLNGSSGTASYLTSGTAPNRTFTFEWLNWYRYGNAGGPSFSMQAQLVEGSNVVRFVYRLETAPISNAGASIGLSGVGTGPSSFLSLGDASATPPVSSTVETTGIATLPATGQVYTFTPPAPGTCPTPRTLAVTATTATSATVSYSVTNAAPGPFTIVYGPTGFNPALPASATNVYFTATSATTTATLTGLTASTPYQFYVTQNCGGTNGNSSRSNAGTFMTACVTPLYAALPVTESFENTWVSRCNTREVPTNNWRNSPATGDNSWRREDDGAGGNWNNATGYAYTPTGSQGTHSARFHSGQASNGAVGTFDLFVNLSAAGAKRLSFDFINTNGSDSLTVDLSNDGGATFTRLARYNLSGTGAPGFVTQVLPISSTSATAVVRFRGRADFGVSDIGLDNIILELATGCLTPAVLTATTTTTTASLSWLTGGTGTYTVLYGPTGFNPALPASATNVYTTAAGLTGPPYAITGLTPGTTYQFYVTLNCAGGTNSGTAGPVAFSTQIVNDEPCGATVLTVNNTCNSLSTTTFGATQTPASVYGSGGAGSGCGFNTAPRDVWFRFTTAATGPTSTQVRISVTGGAASVVSAYSGTACTGPLTFGLCAGTAANTAAPDLDLTGLTPSTTYYVRVSEYSSFGATLGNFTICASPVPNCATPGGLAASNITNTTAALSWLSTGATGSTYTVYYGPQGFTPPAGTALTSLPATSATITGLTPNTAYCFYVQQVCGGFNGSSVFSAPFCFTTPLTAPLSDDPCGATTLAAGIGAVTNGSNVGATTSIQNGISTPSNCSPSVFPKDVWFAFTASATAQAFAFSGPAAGLVRVFTAPSCSAGPFNEIYCRSSNANNVSVGTVTVPNLTVGSRYYLAVSGYGSSDTQGAFTITNTVVTAARAQAETSALTVFPNPSSTGQLTLRLAGLGGPGRATLLNALGQQVRTQPLAATAGQVLPTRGLAPGVYTLRVEVAGQVLTRKVVLE